MSNTITRPQDPEVPPHGEGDVLEHLRNMTQELAAGRTSTARKILHVMETNPAFTAVIAVNEDLKKEIRFLKEVYVLKELKNMKDHLAVGRTSHARDILHVIETDPALTAAIASNEELKKEIQSAKENIAKVEERIAKEEERIAKYKSQRK